MGDRRGQRKPIDVAADVLLYAPVGLAIEIGKHLPELARQGRASLAAPLRAARVVGTVAAMQGRSQFGEKLRRAADPFGGGATADDNEDEPWKEREKPDLPISGYDTLSASQITSHLSGLSRDDLLRVRAYETENRARKTILTRIDHLLDAT